MKNAIRFKEIAKALGIDTDYPSLYGAKSLILELAIENAELRSMLDTIAMYEGLGYAATADEPQVPLPMSATALNVDRPATVVLEDF